MKKFAFVFFVAQSLCIASFSQYWQQQVNFTIDVSLNEKEKTLDAFERITYINHSPDTLHFIWFHLWPNAYKNDRTAFSDQLLENGNTKFYFSDKEKRGYINRLDFKVDGATAKAEDHPQWIDVVKLILPKPLPPSKQVIITTPFHVKLPFNISRSGFDGESFQITQWYPKPAVYDRNGWHPMPYLDQGEFYSEFGNYDVRITVPKNFVVAATGELGNKDELKWMLDRKNVASPTTEKKPNQKSGTKKNIPGKKTTTSLNTSVTETKTLHYKQNSVHDFAWFADKNFVVDTDTVQLPSGKIIHTFTYYYLKNETWKNSLAYLKDATRFYSNEVGEYPYNVVSTVQGPPSFGGGMEYPTITIISPTASAKNLDLTIAHEVGHNWFYGILATNERQHPWMDEGINTFYDNKYNNHKYGKGSFEAEALFQTKAIRKTDQPIETSSEKFSQINYGLVAYHKTAEWMKMLEEKLGNESFKKMMQQYFNDWKFKHPQPNDFKSIVAAQLKDDTTSLFSLLTQKGKLANKELKGTAIITPFQKNGIQNYLDHPSKNVLFISPAIGGNKYDGLMLGGVITNYKLPPADFQFLVAPFYGTASKNITGLGKINYTIHSDGWIRKADLFLNGSTFSMDDFKDTAGRKLVMNFRKLVPGFKLTFREKDPRSTVRKSLQWKTFFINEQSLRIIPDTIFSGSDTALILHYLRPRSSRYINQLQLVYDNDRALYPFNINLQVEQASDFIRPALTANYFFNYAKGGGLGVRFFAGKFMYINGNTLQKQFRNDRYLLNMTGANGYEDYTYSDYFIGRNKFDGLASQQIMIRDGGFKVRTDLLSSKVGKTDNWLIAFNFNSTIPQSINPLSVLPIKIPLRIFADVGTYADAWKETSESDRFLFDAGLHLPLFHEMINIYIPIVYSKVYSTYFKSTIPKNRLFKTISFQINLYNTDLKKLNREIEF